MHKIWRLLAVALVIMIMLSIPVPVSAQTILLSANSGTVGTYVSVTGGGFTPGLTFRIHFASGTMYESLTSGVVGSGGTINSAFYVTPVPAATYTVLVETSGSQFASAAFNVVPSINITSTLAYVGGLLGVSGAGFVGSRTVTITYEDTTVATTTSDAYGNLSAVGFNVPQSFAGSHTVSASDGIYLATATITIQPSVSISPSSGAPGSTAKITGTGYRANQPIFITYDSTTLATIPTPLFANSVGTFTADFTVPPGFNRSQVIYARDGVSSASATFTLLATISLQPSTGRVGSSVTITGSGFQANQTITLAWDDISLPPSTVSITATDVGSFTASFNVPNATNGLHTVKANDGINIATSTFSVTAGVVIDPTRGTAGTQVSVRGNGFIASRSITATWDGAQVAAFTSDSSGSFVLSFNAPGSPGGTHTISISDGTNNVNASFTSLSSIVISPVSGPMGLTITINGSGFGSSRTVAINFSNAQVKTSATRPDGSFTDSFAVPEMSVGQYAVTANDGVNSASTVFTINASMSITPNSGNVGSAIIVRGSGFSGTVTVRYDDFTVATTFADSNGTFSTTFNALASTHGTHRVSAIDSAKTLSTTFTMESVPPSVPRLSMPEDGATVGAQPTLQWEPVTDPSGVTYSLQIALDSGFNRLALQKQGLIGSPYVLTGTESLPASENNAPYYWRVKAIDGASNESDWSARRSFYVSIFPAWAKYTLISLGGILVVLFIFWLGTLFGRRARREGGDL